MPTRNKQPRRTGATGSRNVDWEGTSDSDDGPDEIPAGAPSPEEQERFHSAFNIDRPPQEQLVMLKGRYRESCQYWQNQNEHLRSRWARDKKKLRIGRIKRRLAGDQIYTLLEDQKTTKLATISQEPIADKVTTQQDVRIDDVDMQNQPIISVEATNEAVNVIKPAEDDDVYGTGTASLTRDASEALQNQPIACKDASNKASLEMLAQQEDTTLLDPLRTDIIRSCPSTSDANPRGSISTSVQVMPDLAELQAELEKVKSDLKNSHCVNAGLQKDNNFLRVRRDEERVLRQRAVGAARKEAAELKHKYGEAVDGCNCEKCIAIQLQRNNERRIQTEAERRAKAKADHAARVRLPNLRNTTAQVNAGPPLPTPIPIGYLHWSGQMGDGNARFPTSSQPNAAALDPLNISNTATNTNMSTVIQPTSTVPSSSRTSMPVGAPNAPSTSLSPNSGAHHSTVASATASAASTRLGTSPESAIVLDNEDD